MCQPYVDLFYWCVSPVIVLPVLHICQPYADLCYRCQPSYCVYLCYRCVSLMLTCVTGVSAQLLCLPVLQVYQPSYCVYLCYKCVSPVIVFTCITGVSAQSFLQSHSLISQSFAIQLASPNVSVFPWSNCMLLGKLH